MMIWLISDDSQHFRPEGNYDIFTLNCILDIPDRDGAKVEYIASVI